MSFDKTAISPFDQYCDGYARPGATGMGYVNVLKVSVGTVEKSSDEVLDNIVSYDRAEANDAYIGQINMETASSFNGIVGSIWGYDIARSAEIDNQQPFTVATQYDGTPLPVYEGTPLLESGEKLFGTEQARRFPPAPGAHVICANKSSLAYRPQGKPVDPTSSEEAYGVWCYIAISIAQDRTTAASLFIEDAGLWQKNDNDVDFTAFLNQHRENVIQSIVECGQDQSVIYDRTYISYNKVLMQPGQVGTALTCAPYISLAKNAVPGGDFNALFNMSLSQWEQQVGY